MHLGNWYSRQTDRQLTDTRLTASFLGQTGQAVTRKSQTILDFNEVRDDGVAVASDGPYANHLHLAHASTSSLNFDAKPTASQH